MYLVQYTCAQRVSAAVESPIPTDTPVTFINCGEREREREKRETRQQERDWFPLFSTAARNSLIELELQEREREREKENSHTLTV